MVKRGELYVIFDTIINGKEYFYFPVVDGFGHIDGILKCNEDYHFGLNICKDDVSYIACSTFSSGTNSLVLIVEGNKMICFIPPMVNGKIYSFCKSNSSFFSKYNLGYNSLYMDDKMEFSEKIFDFDDEELSKNQRFKKFLKEIKKKYQGQEEKQKRM